MLAALEAAGFTLVRVLKDDFFAENFLVERGGRRFVVKHSRMRAPLGRVLGAVSRRLIRREQRAYRRLRGIAGVPALVAPLGRTFLVHAYVEGQTLREHRKARLAAGGPGEPLVPDDFFASVEETIDALHRRGIVHLDLSKPDNVLVGTDGRPSLIDFQLALDFGRGALAGPRWQPLFARLRREDLRHLAKLKRKVRRDLLTDTDRARLRRSLPSRLHACVRVPLLALKRLVFPKGSDEVPRWRLASRARATSPRSDARG